MRFVLPALLVFVTACAAAEDSPRTISVTGTGSAAATPDRARVKMSIVVRDKALGVAQDGAARVTAEVLTITDELQIDRSRVDTTGASVSPDYRYNRESNEQELRGYIAERNITVEVRDLDKLGKLVESSVAVGVNQVYPPQLYSSRAREVYREALDNAAIDARANAEKLATALGMRLGAVLQIDAGSVPRPMTAQMQLARPGVMLDAESAATYNAGDASVQTSISVVFEMQPK